jgi:hypothetical protein
LLGDFPTKIQRIFFSPPYMLHGPPTSCPWFVQLTPITSNKFWNPLTCNLDIMHLHYSALISWGTRSSKWTLLHILKYVFHCGYLPILFINTTVSTYEFWIVRLMYVHLHLGPLSFCFFNRPY